MLGSVSGWSRRSPLRRIGGAGDAEPARRFAEVLLAGVMGRPDPDLRPGDPGRFERVHDLLPVRDGEVEHRAPDAGRDPSLRPPAGMGIRHVARLEVPRITYSGADHVDLEEAHAGELSAGLIVVCVGTIPVRCYRVEPEASEVPGRIACRVEHSPHELTIPLGTGERPTDAPASARWRRPSLSRR